jgi:hypothetical protein
MFKRKIISSLFLGLLLTNQIALPVNAEQAQPQPTRIAKLLKNRIFQSAAVGMSAVVILGASALSYLSYAKRKRRSRYTYYCYYEANGQGEAKEIFFQDGNKCYTKIRNYVGKNPSSIVRELIKQGKRVVWYIPYLGMSGECREDGNRNISEW